MLFGQLFADKLPDRLFVQGRHVEGPERASAADNLTRHSAGVGQVRPDLEEERLVDAEPVEDGRQGKGSKTGENY